MRVRRVLAAIVAVVAAATFVKLGLWQLSRAGEKRAAGEVRAARLATAAVVVSDTFATPDPEPGRRVHVVGLWERDRHILLSGRTYLGAAGVAVVTPVRLRSGARVLVERGWLAAPDSRTAHPEHWPESVADELGVAEPIASSPRAIPWVPLAPERAGVELWSARQLDSAGVATHVPGAVAQWVVRATGTTSAGAKHGLVALGEPPGESGERVHLSYAIQWFAFALIVLGGSIALALRDSRRRGSSASS